MASPYGAPRVSLSTVGIGGQKWQVAADRAAIFQGFLDDAARMGLVSGGITSSGGYNPRKIRRKDGTSSPNWSRHAYGEAIDVNALGNEQGKSGTLNPTVARSLAAKYGLTWGGDWSGDTKDPMHFEITRAGQRRQQMDGSQQYDQAAIGRYVYGQLTMQGLDPSRFNIYLRDGNVYARPMGG